LNLIENPERRAAWVNQALRKQEKQAGEQKAQLIVYTGNVKEEAYVGQEIGDTCL
jgi:hypothetical protein